MIVQDLRPLKTFDPARYRRLVRTMWFLRAGTPLVAGGTLVLAVLTLNRGQYLNAGVNILSTIVLMWCGWWNWFGYRT